VQNNSRIYSYIWL